MGTPTPFQPPLPAGGPESRWAQLSQGRDSSRVTTLGGCLWMHQPGIGRHSCLPTVLLSAPFIHSFIHSSFGGTQLLLGVQSPVGLGGSCSDRDRTWGLLLTKLGLDGLWLDTGGSWLCPRDPGLAGLSIAAFRSTPYTLAGMALPSLVHLGVLPTYFGIFKCTGNRAQGRS